MEKTENIRDLEKILRELRVVAIVMNKLANSGHIGGSLSWLHILVALLFSKMKYDPANPKWPERDRLILSKGHGCLALYAALAKLGYFSIDELWKLRRELGALLQGHPYSKIPGIEVTTGSLGQGLSYACTIALSQRLKMVEPLPWIYVILGDGEMQEGQVWEATMFAAHNKIGNLIAILDCNGWQIDGKTEEIMNLNPVAEKWRAFGWQALKIRGHDFNEILKALENAQGNCFEDKPKIIIAETIKGYGAKVIEKNPLKFHGEALNDKEFLEVMNELLTPEQIEKLKGTELGRQTLTYIELIKKEISKKPADEKKISPPKEKPEEFLKNQATRVGFGYALGELGKANPRVLGLTADLAKSVGMGDFAKEFPNQFVDYGVAEANMVSGAGGFAKEGFIPFAGTFAVFMTGRGLDQIRIICYSGDNVKFASSHGGITVGEDGATHQCNEDIAHMRVIPNMTVIVPADAYEARQATLAIAKLNGPVYLRLGRGGTPSVTSIDDEFEIGKAKLMREGNDVTIIACGIMVAKALEAAKILANNAEKSISARVLNMHTIKPIDKEAILNAAVETKAIITAEEHSIIGGLGSAIAEIVTMHMERPVPIRMVGIKDTFAESGKADDLLEKYGLTKDKIVEAVLSVIKKK